MMIEIPSTPHNTSQYLTSNFSEGRTEKIMNVLSEYNAYILQDANNLLLDTLTIDDLCVTGGTMKGIINSKYLESLNISNVETCESTSFCSSLRTSRSNSFSDICDEPKDSIDLSTDLLFQNIIAKQNQIILNLKQKIQNNK
jgi:hypothetical protein